MGSSSVRIGLATIVFALIVGAGLLFFQQSRTEQPLTARFADQIDSFVEWDRKNSFSPDAVLFVGSSSIRRWPTRESFPDLPVINRGFGGSQIREVNKYFDQVVAPYRPRIIVFYAGDNDIAAGRTPEQVRDDFDAFMKRVRAVAPQVPVVFLSIKPSPRRWDRWSQMQEANALVRAMTTRDAQLHYLDVGLPLLGEDGRPRAEYYVEDNLHLSPEGYRIWVQQLSPVLQKLMVS